MFKNKILFLALILGLLFFVSACNDDSATTDTDGEDNNNEDGSHFVLTGDTVSEQQGCVLASRFTVGEKIVFRIDAIDPITNEQIKDAKLQVHLSTGDVIDMVYGQHPANTEGAPYFYTAAYTVTEDTPTGTLEYYVTGEAGERTAEFRPFNVAPSLLTIVAPEAANGDAHAEEAEEATAEVPTDVETNQNVDLVATNWDFNEDVFYVKAGEEVTVNLTSEEGGHGIFIEGLDVAINEPNGTATFTPSEAGEYKIVCSIFCGEGHAEMTATLVVVA